METKRRLEKTHAKNAAIMGGFEVMMVAFLNAYPSINF
jgi:hypothetical protein